jgi:hypothetical protein
LHFARCADDVASCEVKVGRTSVASVAPGRIARRLRSRQCPRCLSRRRTRAHVLARGRPTEYQSVVADRKIPQMSTTFALPQRLLVAMCLAATSCSTCSNSSNPVPPADGLVVAPSKATFALNDRVVLRVVLSNRGSTPCFMGNDSDGAMSIVEMTRDGVAVVPTMTTSTWISGFTGFYAAHWSELAPGASVSFDWQGTTPSFKERTLNAYTMAGFNQTDVSRYDVSKPGSYRVLARYLAPRDATFPSSLCGVSGVAVVTFSISGAS